MKTISALFASAITAIAILLFALLFGSCSKPSQPTDTDTPAIPTTMVYTIDAPGGFDRQEIAYGKPKDSKPETFFVDGKATALSLDQAFEALESDTADIFNTADLRLASELGDGVMTDNHTTEISVLKAVTCKSIHDHTPVDETTTFAITDSRAWCHTQVALPKDKSGLIQHVWKHEGVEQLRVELFVQGPTYRTSSYKTMNPKGRGHWTVEVTTENGDVLDVVEFVVE
jgi:hypothetical protein